MVVDSMLDGAGPGLCCASAWPPAAARSPPDAPAARTISRRVIPLLFIGSTLPWCLSTFDARVSSLGKGLHETAYSGRTLAHHVVCARLRRATPDANNRSTELTNSNQGVHRR